MSGVGPHGIHRVSLQTIAAAQPFAPPARKTEEILSRSRAEKVFQAARSLAEDIHGVGYRMTCEYLAIQKANLMRLGRSAEAEQSLTETPAIRDSLSDNCVMDLTDLHGILAELDIEIDRIQMPDHPSRVRLLEAVTRSRESIGETAQADESRSRAEVIRSKFRVE